MLEVDRKLYIFPCCSQYLPYENNLVLTEVWVVAKQISQFVSVDAEDDLVLT